MWRADSLWLEVAVVMSIFAVGNVLFGHFEEHKPKWRRLLKLAVYLGVVLALSVSLGRAWAFGFLLLHLPIVVVVHLWWLPKHGVNGWTGEPKARYYELIGHKQ